MIEIKELWILYGYEKKKLKNTPLYCKDKQEASY